MSTRRCGGIIPYIVYLFYFRLLFIYFTLDYNLFFTLDARLLVRRQYSEGPATGQLDTGFS